MDRKTQNIPEYSSIEDIRLRKEEILKAIRLDSGEIGVKWKSMFSAQEQRTKKGFNMASLVNTGTGLVDGFLLAWKLYRKFRR